MKCLCPKCKAHIELDLPNEIEESAPAQCPECKSRFTVTRESFGGRALRKTGEVACVTCGELLGPGLRCDGCGALFPDYLVGSVGRKKKRVQKVQLKSVPFPERKTPAGTVPRLNAPLPQAPKEKGKAKGGAPAKRYTWLVASILLLILVGGGGAAGYQHYKKGKEATNNFILAIYCTRIGEKKSLDACNKIAADWKAKGDDQSAPPHAAATDLQELGNIKAKLNDVLGRMDREHYPQDLQPSLDKLDRLRAAYEKASTLARTPSGTLPAYTAASAAADAEYRAAARELKAGLPPGVVEKIKTASKRYKGLQGFLEL